MTSYTISPIWGAGAQLFDNSGNPLAGGKIYTYYAGSTTPLTTYTTPLGNTANSNPIIANSAGRLTNEIWLPVSGAYKFVLKDSNDVLIATYDNIPTIPQPPIVNDASSISYEQGYEVDAGNFTIGATYLITSVGTTDFIAIGAAGNVTGILFTATGVGSGTGKAAFSRTVQTKLQETLSVKDFGAVGDGVTDDTVALQAALASGELNILIPQGEYKITDTLVVPTYVNLIGYGSGVSIISVDADVVGIQVIGGISKLSGFSVNITGTHTTNGIEIGSVATNGGRTIIDSVGVSSAGQDGISIINGNLGVIRDCGVANCGRDGINFTLDTIDNNAWTIEGFNDISNNTRDGVHLSMGTSATDAYAPKSNTFSGIVAQSNGRYGVYVGTRSNVITAYAEANTTTQVYLDTYAYGNQISTTEGQVTDNGSFNTIFQYNPTADYARNIKTNTVQISAGEVGYHSTNPYTLDAYIEGVWTPVPAGLSVSGTPTYTGRYVKVGRIVHATMVVASTVSTSGTAGSFYFTGLPFLTTYATSSAWTVTAVNSTTFASYGVGYVASGRVYPPTWSGADSVVVSFTYMADS